MTQEFRRSQGMPFMTSAALKILSAGAVKYVLTGMAPAFTRDTGTPVEFAFGTIAGVRQQLKDGARPDIIIGTDPAVTAMEQAGAVAPASRVEIGRAPSGLGVRAGTAVPDISTPERFRAALLAARSIAFTDPQAGGTSGLYLVGLLEKLGIADAVRRKAILCANGDVVVDKVLAGEAELASTFISEIITREGMAVVGPFPAAIAHGMSYAGALATTGANREAARTFLARLSDPAQRSYLASRGFEPPG
jgi:molybdate transport system substrate-binding protein